MRCIDFTINAIFSTISNNSPKCLLQQRVTGKWYYLPSLSTYDDYQLLPYLVCSMQMQCALYYNLYYFTCASSQYDLSWCRLLASMCLLILFTINFAYCSHEHLTHLANAAEWNALLFSNSSEISILGKHLHLMSWKDSFIL